MFLPKLISNTRRSRSACTMPGPSTLNPQRSTSPGSGFTLIEMLMVMAVIAILIGLLVPVIYRAFKAGKEAAEIADIQGLGTGIQKFKDRYGIYPPSHFILREDGDYDVTRLPVIGPTATGQDTAVFDENVSIQYLRRLWPHMIIHTDGTAVTPAEIGDINQDNAVDAGDFYDWNGDGIKNGPWYLQADECLVFFVGGLPTGQRPDVAATGTRANSGPPGTLGFGKTPAWPTQRVITGAGRDGPFFDFPSDRLMDRDSDQFYEFIPFRKVKPTPPFPPTFPTGEAPYVYFSAYDGAGYRPDDFNVTWQPNGDPSTRDNFGVSWSLSSSYPAATRRGSGTATDPYYLNSPAPNPYTVNPYPSPPSPFPAGWVPRYHKPDSFQIISPGLDLSYGDGGEYPLPPRKPGPDDVLGTSDDTRPLDDEDNLTSFTGSELKDGKL